MVNLPTVRGHKEEVRSQESEVRMKTALIDAPFAKTSDSVLAGKPFLPAMLSLPTAAAVLRVQPTGSVLHRMAYRAGR